MVQKPIVIGNWKMNCGPNSAKALAEALLKQTASCTGVDIRVAPPAISLPVVCEVLSSSSIQVGAQNVYFEDSGAFTGEISPSMVKELGASFTLAGHSERRTLMLESDSLVNQRALGAEERGLQVVFCIGESQQEREAGAVEAVLRRQLEGYLSRLAAQSSVILAYEPVWAIGTGLTATPPQISEAIQILRGIVREYLPTLHPSVLYGGSVTPDNFKEILSLPEVDGALVGGASLVAEKFTALCEIASDCRAKA